MGSGFFFTKREASTWRLRCLCSLCLVAAVLFFVSPSMAVTDFELYGKPARVMGFVNQGAGYGVGGDEYDTKEGFQSFKYDILLETEYQPRSDLDVFVSGMLSGDWAYDILNNSNEWTDKGFNQSRDELYIDTDFRDLLQEAHVTWHASNFLSRLGKQIVVWGETDGFRLMDQINPVDNRRGITDVEFESTILPLWLGRAEYFLQPESSWLQDLGFEFIFNPNADFDPNRNIVPGNDRVGIWAPNVQIPLEGPYPNDFAHLGSIDADVEEPDEWDPDYFEYGLRLKSVIQDTIVTLNYFYGIDNDPAAINLPLPPRMEVSDYDGRLIIHPAQEAYYPRFRFAGFTLTRDFENLNVSALGGVAPVLRLEAFYAFDNTFSTTLPPGLDRFEEHDEIRYAIGVDWKVKINWLNPRAYFFISPQFYHRHIRDFPSGYNLQVASGPLYDDNYQTSLMISTTYFHNKLEPSFFWLDDRSGKSGFIRPQIKYEYSDVWNFTLGAIFIDGEKTGWGFEPLENKDHVYFTVAYKF